MLGDVLLFSRSPKSWKLKSLWGRTLGDISIISPRVAGKRREKRRSLAGDGTILLYYYYDLILTENIKVF